MHNSARWRCRRLGKDAAVYHQSSAPSFRFRPAAANPHSGGSVHGFDPLPPLGSSVRDRSERHLHVGRSVGSAARLRLARSRPHRQVIAHAGGIDEMLFVLVPLIVFLVLQWLSRRKAAVASDTDETPGERIERRHRLAGGLIPNAETDGTKVDGPPSDTVD